MRVHSWTCCMLGVLSSTLISVACSLYGYCGMLSNMQGHLTNLMILRNKILQNCLNRVDIQIAVYEVVCIK